MTSHNDENGATDQITAAWIGIFIDFSVILSIKLQVRDHKTYVRWEG